MLFEIETSIDTYKEKENKLNDLENGFFKGNMFETIYEGYKNYHPCKIEPKDEQTSDLLYIMMLDFAIGDLNLYLDIHKEDKEMYETFKQYTNAYKRLLADYERKYQVLYLIDDTLGKYTWIKKPWPWEDLNV